MDSPFCSYPIIIFKDSKLLRDHPVLILEFENITWIYYKLQKIPESLTSSYFSLYSPTPSSCSLLKKPCAICLQLFAVSLILIIRNSREI